jgi:hypothetical protein
MPQAQMDRDRKEAEKKNQEEVVFWFKTRYKVTGLDADFIA